MIGEGVVDKETMISKICGTARHAVSISFSILKKTIYRLVFPALMASYIVDCQIDLDEYMEQFSWIVPFAMIVVLLIVDRWHPALLLRREDNLIVFALLMGPLLALGTDWLENGSEAQEFMDSMGQCGLFLFLALYLYYYHPEDFRISVRLMSLVIWISALAGLWNYYDAGYLQSGVTTKRLIYPYGHAIPAAHAWIMGLWLPLTNHKVTDVILKCVYLPAIFLTMSRSSWIALGVTATLCLVQILKELKKLGVWKSLAIFAVLGALAAAAWQVLQSETVQAILEYRLTGVTDTHAYVMRTTHWPYIIQEFLKADPLQMLFGFGRGSITTLIAESGLEDGTWLIADNSYLSLMYEMGLVLIAALLLVMLKAGIRFLQAKSVNELMQGGILSLISGFIVILFYDVQTYPVTVLPMTVSAAIILADYRNKAYVKRALIKERRAAKHLSSVDEGGKEAAAG